MCLCISGLLVKDKCNPILLPSTNAIKPYTTKPLSVLSSLLLQKEVAIVLHQLPNNCLWWELACVAGGSLYFALLASKQGKVCYHQAENILKKWKVTQPFGPSHLLPKAQVDAETLVWESLRLHYLLRHCWDSWDSTLFLDTTETLLRLNCVLRHYWDWLLSH